MDLTIVVIMHNMRREAARTLHSLSREYQRGVGEIDYEVIVIDNGSSSPLGIEAVEKFGPNFRYHYHETSSPSPAEAVNLGATMGHGEHLAVIVDGARMASPGLIRDSIAAAQSESGAFVCALAWHLGPSEQRLAVANGYDQETEDRLLASIGWPDDGYRLFDISELAHSSIGGLKGGLPVECSWFVMQRTVFLDMGGFDERFQSPGGGLVNHDFLLRILSRGDLAPIVLNGEGTFHQVHGGISTNATDGSAPDLLFQEEFRRIRQMDYAPDRSVYPQYFGAVPQQAGRFLAPLPKRLVRRMRAWAKRLLKRGPTSPIEPLR